MIRLKKQVTLWQHQQKMLHHLQTHPKAALFAGMATGKTLTILSYLDWLTHERGARSFLILCPVAVRDVWARELAKFCEPTYNLLVLDRGTLTDKTADLIDFMGHEHRVVVVNYETAKNLPLEMLHFDAVIADESHKLKSHNSQMSTLLAVRCKDIPYKVVMTGTPFDDRPLDVYGQIRFLDAQHTGTLGRSKRPRVWSEMFGTYAAFFERFVNYRMMNNIKIPTGYKNLETLQDMINTYALQIKTDDVIDLPEQLFVPYYIPLEGRMRKLYKDMANDFIARYEDGVMTASNVLVQALRLHQLTGGYFKADDADTPPVTIGEYPKMHAVLELLDECGNEPVVIFTRFQTDVNLLAAALHEAEISYSLLTGEHKQWVQWQEGYGGRVLIANIQAGNAGVDLSRARICIFYSLGHSRTNLHQALYRVRRPSSDIYKPVVYYQLIVEHTVDEAIWRAMDDKRDIAEALASGIYGLETNNGH